MSENHKTTKNLVNPLRKVVLMMCAEKKNITSDECAVIYESETGDFLNQGGRVKLMNKYNVASNCSLTVAHYEDIAKKETVVRDSSRITQLIGHSNYELLFSVLCSVINQELKVRAILALLTVPKNICDASTQTDEVYDKQINPVEVDNKLTQTEETNLFSLSKVPVRRKRSRFNAYTVKDCPIETTQLKKLVINPENFKDFSNMSFTSNARIKDTVLQTDLKQVSNELPLLQLDEDSRESLGQYSVLSVNTCPDLLYNPFRMLQNIDSVTQESQSSTPFIQSVYNDQFNTNSTIITLLDNTKVKIPWKIEDHFHIVTPELIKHVPPRIQNSLVLYQLYIDWKYSLVPDADQHLPIHVAALNGDMDLLRRQCAVLKANGHSVDIPTGDNLTALQISIYGDEAACTSVLLRAGADPLVLDDSYKSCFHLAAEAASDHLKALVNHCMEDPLSILEDNEELWKPELASKSKEFLSSYLLEQISTTYDVQGYSPLMLATFLGRYGNVKTLLEAFPSSVNIKMPNSGNSPLFTAVSAAYQDCVTRGNKSMVSTEFMRTIEILIEHGADLTIQNHSGMDVNALLSDLNMPALSILVVDKVNARVTGVSSPSGTSSVTALILIKDRAGNLSCDVASKTHSKPKRRATDYDDVIIHDIKPEQVSIKDEYINISPTDKSPIIKNENTLRESQTTLSNLRSYRKTAETRPIGNKEISLQMDPLSSETPLKLDNKEKIVINKKSTKASRSKPIILKQDIVKKRRITKKNTQVKENPVNTNSFMSTFHKFLDKSTNNALEELHNKSTQDEHSKAVVNPLTPVSEHVSQIKSNMIINETNSSGAELKSNECGLKQNTLVTRAVHMNSAVSNPVKSKNDSKKKKQVIILANNPLVLEPTKPIPVAIVANGNASNPGQSKAPMCIVSRMNKNTSETSILSQSSDTESTWNAPLKTKWDAQACLTKQLTYIRNKFIEIAEESNFPSPIVPKQKTVVNAVNPETQNIPTQITLNPAFISNSIIPTLVCKNTSDLLKSVSQKSSCLKTSVITANTGVIKANVSESNIVPSNSANTITSQLHTGSAHSIILIPQLSRKRDSVTPKVNSDSAVKRVKK